MTPEQFLVWAEVFPEALWLIRGDGQVLAANAVAGRMVGRRHAALIGTPLAELVMTPPAHLANYLHACSRTRAMVPGGLTFRGTEGEALECRAEGAVLRPRTTEESAVLLLRCRPRRLAAQPFVALNEKIQELIRANTQLRRAHEALRQQREHMEVTLSSIGDAVMATDAQGRITFMNAVAERLTGWPEDEALGRDLTEVFRIINEESRQVVENPVAKVVREGMVVGLANHTVLIARNAVERPIDDSGAPIRDRQGRLIGVVLVFRDVTERKRAEQGLLVHHATTRILAEAGAFDDAIPRILELIGQHFGWDVGVLWRVDRRAQVLRCAALWSRPSLPTPAFEAVSRERTFAPGVRLPGRVWATGEPTWIMDVTEDAGFLRTPQAAQDGLHAALGVPIRLGTDVLGVIEFCSRERRQLDPELLDMMATIGSQVGLHIERQRAEAALRENEARFRVMAETAPVMIWVADTDMLCTWFNKPWLDFTGRTMAQELGNGWAEGVHADDFSRCLETYRTAFEAREPFTMEYRLRRADGVYRWVLDRGVPRGTSAESFAGYIGSAVDITELKQAEAQLSASLHEKEALLREIHHRVKNNLQVISSLLSLQAECLANPAVRALFEDSQQRIQAMALVYETLYQSTDLTRVELAHYIPRVAEQLFETYRGAAQRVRLSTAIEAASVGVETAIPCGLLLGELLSNSLRHAFPGGRAGEIHIALRVEPTGQLTLTVRDNGVGVPPEVDFRNPSTLGLQLVTMLADQLEGTIAMDPQDGTTFTMTFGELRYRARG
jgi:PAS domain S-box-containing protein